MGDEEEKKFIAALEIAFARQNKANPWGERVTLMVASLTMVGMFVGLVTSWVNTSRDIQDLRASQQVQDSDRLLMRKDLIQNISAHQELQAHFNSLSSEVSIIRRDGTPSARERLSALEAQVRAINGR